jgi:Flp pilus assembly protein CpaB
MRLNRLRLRALARPARRWAVAVVLAGLTATVVHGTVQRAAAARAGWGTTRRVLVAGADLAPGTALAGAPVRVVSWPVRLLTDDAISPDDLAPEAGSGDAVLAVAVLAGEPLRRAHLRGGAAGAVPAGRRVVAVPAGAAPGLRPGDLVDVVDAEDASVAAHAAVVMSAAEADDTVTIAVRADELSRVATATARGQVVLALTPDD